MPFFKRVVYCLLMDKNNILQYEAEYYNSLDEDKPFNPLQVTITQPTLKQISKAAAAILPVPSMESVEFVNVYNRGMHIKNCLLTALHPFKMKEHTFFTLWAIALENENNLSASVRGIAIKLAYNVSMVHRDVNLLKILNLLKIVEVTKEGVSLKKGDFHSAFPDLNKRWHITDNAKNVINATLKRWQEAYELEKKMFGTT